jgi:small-conductance mechanosensitive channel
LPCLLCAACTFLFAQDAAAPLFDTSRIIPFLDQTLTWYRQMAVNQQIASDLSETTIVNNNRQLADQVVRLSFDFARAEAATAEKNRSTQVQAQTAGSSQEQPIVKAEQQATQDLANAETQLNSLNQKLSSATGKQRQTLQQQIVQAQGNVNLQKARSDAIHTMAQFMAGTGAGAEGGGLTAQIDGLAASVPAIEAASNNNQTNTNTKDAKDQSNTDIEENSTEPAGLWDLGANIFGISRKLRTIDTAITQTQALANSSTDLRTPIANRLRALIQNSDQVTAQAPGQNAGTIAQEQQKIDAATAEFKQLVAIAIPLSKQTILLGLYEKTLENWHTEVRGDLGAQMGRLAARLVILALFVGLVLVVAGIAKRAIYRYVHEPHRRYQFLLLRKIGLAFTLVIVIAFAFASRLESAVTFAGLLTAGVAVALQNVIVAIVGYFFLIGRYGIRVGDRVQINGVTGEVVDIGLVRIHVMELGGSSADSPTGREVAFSNSVVFQPTSGIFKQIPGTSFVWHEISLTLAADNDFKQVRERLLRAVNTVLADYHEEMDRQNQAMERNLIAAPENGLRPKVHLRLTPAGLEAMIRFPVDLRRAGEMDEQVTNAILKAVNQEPKLKFTGSGAGITLRTELSVAGT